MEDKILKGLELNEDQVFQLCHDLPLDKLLKLANSIREKFLGKELDTCSIVNAKSGKCSENCKWCAQSAHNKTGCTVYDCMSVKEALKFAKQSYEQGIKRFSLVTSGRTLSEKDTQIMADCFKEIAKQLPKLKLCGSFGLLSYNQFVMLKEAGMSRFHCNMETAPSYFSKLCTTHTSQDKIESIINAKKAKLEVCSGGIIGMGETFKQRIELAFVLKNIGVDSIPLNILQPIKNTPLENMKPLSKEEILKTFAMFRIVNKKAHIRFAGGRLGIKEIQSTALKGGISGILMGDMLTTIGSKVAEDFQMIKSMGYEY